jgi:CubicO group peptidase (beta-lactamase class C family)
MSHVKAVYPFRTRWGYTNAAFLTAGQIITSVTDRSWESYIKDYIFAPLGMSNTLALSKDMPLAYNKAAPHTIADGRLIAIPFCQIDNLAPAGSISSSVNDLSKWVLAQLNNGRVGPRQFIPEAAIITPHQAQDVVYDNGTGNAEMYGMGWFLKDYAGHRMVSHTGGVNGYVSSVTMVPDQNLGIIILTNTDQNNLIETLNYEIVDTYLHKPYHNYSDENLSAFKNKTFKEQQQDKKLADSVALHLQPALPLTTYTGKYFSDLYGNMTVDQGGENNELQMHFEHHPKMYARMQPLGGHRFYITFSDPEFGKAVFPFTVINGKVTGVRVKVADFIEYTPYEFRKVQ